SKTREGAAKKSEDLLKQESNVFARLVQKLGYIKEVHHEINTDNTRLIKQSAYHISSSIREFVQQEIDQLKERDLIRES
ncbi:2787_t:CDS:1, partial [Acaulospora morrowiae]